MNPIVYDLLVVWFAVTVSIYLLRLVSWSVRRFGRERKPDIIRDGAKVWIDQTYSTLRGGREYSFTQSTIEVGSFLFCCDSYESRDLPTVAYLLPECLSPDDWPDPARNHLQLVLDLGNRARRKAEARSLARFGHT